MSSRTTANKDLGALDFELTNFADARHALEELPAGIGELHRMKPGYWEKQRRTPLPTDKALAGMTIDWLVNLPPPVQPRLLAERYPRIVNRIAETWTSGQRCQETFDDLLADRLGGRHGFPYEVDVELQSLRRFRAMLQHGGGGR